MDSQSIMERVRDAATRGGDPLDRQDGDYLEARSNYEIDDNIVYPDPEYILTVNETPVMPLGNIVALSAKWKNGKTFFCDILAAIFLGSSRFAGCNSLMEQGKVLFFDTEQAKSDTARVKRIIRRMIPEQRKRDIKVFCLRDANIEGDGDTARTIGRYDFIKLSIEREQPRLVIIDGIADLIYNYNDVYESMNVVNNLATLANEHNCCIVTVMHQNKGAKDKNMKGHIGTMLFQKCSDVFTIEKTGSLFYVEHQVSRHKQAGGFAFSIALDGTPTDAAADRQLQESMEARKALNALTEEMLTAMDGSEVALSRTVIASQLMSKMGLKRSPAFRKVKKAIDMGVLQSRDRRHFYINPELINSDEKPG